MFINVLHRKMKTPVNPPIASIEENSYIIVYIARYILKQIFNSYLDITVIIVSNDNPCVAIRFIAKKYICMYHIRLLYFCMTRLRVALSRI